MVLAVERNSNIDFQQVNFKQSHLSITSSHQISTLTSIEQIKKDSQIKRFLMAPISLLNFLWKKLKYFIGNYLLCCFPSCRDPVNWAKAKPIFEKIYQVIVKRDQYVNAKDQDTRFKEALSNLPKDALERFKYHIGICRIGRADRSLTDREKALWYKKNKESIDFKEDYFDWIKDNHTLENAVKSFWEEIQLHS